MCPRDVTRTPCITRDGEQEITEPNHIANTFNEYFTNVASQYTSDSQDTRQQQHTQLKHFVSDKLDTSFLIPDIKQHTVYRALMALRSDKSTGADKISARLLKAGAPAITVSVTTLINKSIVSGTFPTLWKLAKITPIHKKGPTENKGNYRQISILCALSKILGRHVHDIMYTYLMSHNMLHEGQSGFRAKHSCETALNHMVHEWAAAIEKGLMNGIVLLGLRKAFNLVNHTILLDKLAIYGCSQQSMRWFSSYLSERKQFVLCKGKQSEQSEITTGVPQGSILGPMFFIVFTNDMPMSKRTISNMDMYADDSTISACGKKVQVSN